MSKRKLTLVSVGVELLGVTVVSMGLGVEIALHADWGYGLITGGSLLVAAGGILWGKLLRLKP